MADKRKLQCEIDKTLKRVQDGRASFQDILDKFEGSVNQTQKEKYEADLKKEIKKLQRLRDQIKTWLSCNEIKDKRSLQEARKDIEQDMERFKVIEKETKTKAYSKEGLLSADAKKDPAQKEKEELDDWLKQSISSLKDHFDKYEYEFETMAKPSKNKRVDKERAAIVEKKKKKLELCSFHIEKLETVMRHFDNERLDCSKVRQLKDSVADIIASLDYSISDEYRTLYEDLRLEDLSDISIILPNATGVGDSEIAATTTVLRPSKSEDLPEVIILPAGSSTSSNASSSRERPKASEEKPNVVATSVTSTSTPIKNIDATSGGGGRPGPCAVSKPNKANNVANQTAPASLFVQATASPNKNVSSKSNAPTTPNGQSVPTAKASSEIDTGKTVGGTKSDHESAEKSAEVHREKYAKVAAESKFTGKSAVVGTIGSGSCSSKSGKQQCLESAVSDSKSTSCGAHQTPQSTPLKSDSKCGSSTKTNDHINPDAPTHKPVKESKEHTAVSPSVTPEIDQLSPSESSGKPTRTSYSVLNATPVATVASELMDYSADMATTVASRLNVLPSAAAYLPLPIGSSAMPSCGLSSTQQQQQRMVTDAAVSALHHQQAVAVMAAQQQQRMTSPCVIMHPRDCAAPFRSRQFDKPKNTFPPELLGQIQALDTAYRRLPHPCDTEKARMIVSKQPVLTPSYYPSEPLISSDTEEYFSRLDPQTLFFLFYYFEGTKTQYLAAKALKRQSWRFHTKHMMWFQRHEEPKLITDDFEAGTYIYYDFKSMSQRKKEDFYFYYSYLEDKEF